MKPVVQKHSLGCGVACVAFVLGKSYDEAMPLFPQGSKKAGTIGFLCREIAKALEKAGKNYEYRYIKPRVRRRIYENGTIVFIKKSKKYPAGHYLARATGKWMDPWINFGKEKDFEKARAGVRKRLPGKPIYAILSVH